MNYYLNLRCSAGRSRSIYAFYFGRTAHMKCPLAVYVNQSCSALDDEVLLVASAEGQPGLRDAFPGPSQQPASQSSACRLLRPCQPEWGY